MGITRRTATPCKAIQESLGFWIARRGFRMDSTICPWNLYILDSNLKKDFGFHNQAGKNFPDSLKLREEQIITILLTGTVEPETRKFVILNEIERN